MTSRQEFGETSNRKLDLMVDELLPSSFNLRIWEQISTRTPEEYINNQKDILKILLSDYKLFQSFFLRFYTNHQHLNDWYMLANSNQVDIKQYVFTELLAKRLKQYRQIIKGGHSETRYGRNNQPFREKETTRKEKKKQSFHKMHLSNAKSTTILYSHSKDHSRTFELTEKYEFLDKQIEKQDYHQLFLKTFSACDGSKYIYYDFNKHMRGISGKKRYNQYIRIKKHKKNQSNNIEFNITTDLLGQSARKRDHCFKSTHNSLHFQQNIDFLHQKEDLLTHVNYCNFQMDAIGQIKNKKYLRQALLLKRTTGGLKKVKAYIGKDKCQLKKRKVL